MRIWNHPVKASIPLRLCEFLASTDLQVDYEAQGLILADTFAPRQNVFDLCVFFDVLSASGLPGHKRARMAREISLGKDMVREVRQALTLEVWQIEADALGRGLGVPGVVTAYVFIVHPDGYRDIHDDKAKCSFRAAASTTREQVLDSGAGLETHRSAVLPPDD